MREPPSAYGGVSGVTFRFIAHSSASVLFWCPESTPSSANHGLDSECISMGERRERGEPHEHGRIASAWENFMSTGESHENGRTTCAYGRVNRVNCSQILVKFLSNSTAYQYSRARQNLHPVQAFEPVEKERSGMTRQNDRTTERRSRATQQNDVRELPSGMIPVQNDAQEQRKRTTPDKYSAEFDILQSSPTGVSYQIPTHTSIPERDRTTYANDRMERFGTRTTPENYATERRSRTMQQNDVRERPIPAQNDAKERRKRTTRNITTWQNDTTKRQNDRTTERQNDRTTERQIRTTQQNAL